MRGAAALALDEVRIAPSLGNLTRLPLSLEVGAGELAMISVIDQTQGNTFANVAGGVIPAKSGTVSVLGQDWSRLDLDAANDLRGRIGRLLTRGRWLEGLPIVENILLPQLHHSRRSREELLHEAAHSARQFGLPGIPTTSPQQMLPADLQRAGFVRAFLGTPALVLLEEPTQDVPDEILPPLVNACLEAMHRGAAVVWLTCRQDLVHDPKIPAAHRFVAEAGNLLRVTI